MGALVSTITGIILLFFFFFFKWLFRILAIVFIKKIVASATEQIKNKIVGNGAD